MSKKRQLSSVFRELPLFADCTDAELQEVQSLSCEVNVPAGRDIISQGDLGREFVLILDGEAIVSRDDNEVARLGSGAYFGELALLEAIPRNATVTAATDMRLEVIDGRGFRTLLADSPGLTLNLLRGTARRLSTLERSDAGEA